jgi:formylmethanofuran dehydrogenase subunit D
VCETFGHDLVTGAVVDPVRYRADDPAGKALIKPCDYEPPHEAPDDDYPLWLTTGRVVYHFHTRTKTARARALNAAAPEPFVQIAEEDAKALGIEEGDAVEVTSRRGSMRAQARIGDIEPGLVFVPFHYGDFDEPGRDGAANRLTLTEWDAVSKQPHFKYAAVRVSKVTLATRAADLAEAVSEGVSSAAAAIRSTIGSGPGAGRSHVADYLGMAEDGEGRLAEAFDTVAERHGHEPDVNQMCRLLASWSRGNREALGPLIGRYGETGEGEPASIHRALFHGPRKGGLGLVRDLHDLWLLAQEVKLTYELLTQAALALRDEEMELILGEASSRTRRQSDWLRTRLDHAAPQVLTVPS